jgi:hypothetical protein
VRESRDIDQAARIQSRQNAEPQESESVRWPASGTIECQGACGLMRKLTAFYAWQSDIPRDVNQDLIEIALKDAAKRITEDPSLGVELQVDSDTQGVPGTPPITDTILKKIESCDMFIPDVTFVARTEEGKYIPNPNVMAEFGYALRAKTHSAIVTVMNTAFGPPEKLPFDMGHLRHPIQYSLETAESDSLRRTVRADLSRKIEGKLRLQIAATPVLPRDTYASDRLRLVREDLERLKEPWQKPLLRELIIRGKMGEAHASGFLVRQGFPHLSGALNGLEFHTNLVVHDSVGQYSIKAELLDTLATVMEEQENQ